MAANNSNFLSLAVNKFSNYDKDCIISNASSLVNNPLFIQTYLGLEAIFMILSTVLNSAIIVSVCTNVRLHTVPYVFIVSLAVSDLIISYSFGVTEFVLFDRGDCFFTEPFKCTRVFIIAFAVASNICNHLAISVERWLYIAYPYIYQRIVSRRSTAYSLAFVWVMAAVLNVNMAIKNCGVSTFRRLFNMGIVRPILHFFLCVVMLAIYTHIALLTRRAIRNINKTRPVGVIIKVQDANKSLASVKSAWKNIRMLVTVFGTFFIFSTPCVGADIYDYSMDQNVRDSVVGKVIDMLWSTHCCVNFFIYAAQDRAFIDALKKGVGGVRQSLHQMWCRRVYSESDEKAAHGKG